MEIVWHSCPESLGGWFVPATDLRIKETDVNTTPCQLPFLSRVVYITPLFPSQISVVHASALCSASENNVLLPMLVRPFIFPPLYLLPPPKDYLSRSHAPSHSSLHSAFQRHLPLPRHHKHQHPLQTSPYSAYSPRSSLPPPTPAPSTLQFRLSFSTPPAPPFPQSLTLSTHPRFLVCVFPFPSLPRPVHTPSPLLWSFLMSSPLLFVSLSYPKH